MSIADLSIAIMREELLEFLVENGVPIIPADLGWFAGSTDALVDGLVPVTYRQCTRVAAVICWNHPRGPDESPYYTLPHFLAYAESLNAE